MVYKIKKLDDISSINNLGDEAHHALVHYVNILSSEYNYNDVVDSNLGGCILYISSGTASEDILAYFDYKNNNAEFIAIDANVCIAVFITGDDYGIVMIMDIEVTPQEILNKATPKSIFT